MYLLILKNITASYLLKDIQNEQKKKRSLAIIGPVIVKSLGPVAQSVVDQTPWLTRG